MAESFSNYCSVWNFSTSQTGVKNVIVPAAGNKLSGSNSGDRPAGAITQLHSIYISQAVTSKYSDPTEHPIYLSIKVKDSSKEWYLANNVMILPHSAFYIEKTVTLMTTQQLLIEYTSLNTIGGEIDCICSGVDIL